MKLFRRSCILPAFVFAVFLFLSTQYYFFYNISVDSTNKFQPVQSEISSNYKNSVNSQNENFNVRGRTIIVPKITARSITSTAPHNKKIIKTKQLQVPLNDRNKPYLHSMLPFFHILNQKFKTVDADEPTQALNEFKKPAVSLRGVDLKKILLYYPDKNSQFKCLDSNVTSK
jgi:hypothetical protein